MLNKSVVERVLLRASETGADFAELFVEQGRDLHLSMGAGKVNAAVPAWKAVPACVCLK